MSSSSTHNTIQELVCEEISPSYTCSYQSVCTWTILYLHYSFATCVRYNTKEAWISRYVQYVILRDQNSYTSMGQKKDNNRADAVEIQELFLSSPFLSPGKASCAVNTHGKRKWDLVFRNSEKKRFSLIYLDASRLRRPRGSWNIE